MKNIILIGMPGCGKSTIGVVLAKMIGYRFTDSDIIIQEKDGRLLCEIIEQEGIEGFNAIEDKINSEIKADRTVIATGGSVIYGKNAMEHFKQIGVIVYIRMPFDGIKMRLGDLAKRGVSMKKGQTLKELYDERVPLYEKYADIIIDEKGKGVSETAVCIKDKVKLYFAQK